MSYSILYEKFALWLDELLKNGFPSNTAALVFNLYERSDQEHCWYAELGFCECFDASDKSGGWACYAQLCEPVFVWDSDNEWETAQSTAEHLVKMYLENGCHSDDIRSLNGVGVGFAEGDLNIIYENSSSTASAKEYKHYDPHSFEELANSKIADLLSKMNNK